MYTVKTLNKIAAIGTERFNTAKITVNDMAENPDAIIVRSADMQGYSFNDGLLCVARAGAGYNNIPVDLCAEKGIVVFNTPGANANGVKELVICALLLASRDVIGSIDWVRGIADKGDEIPALVEKGKSNFAGPEIMGKSLALLGVGAVGAKVARAAQGLGMTVYGYDLSDEVKSGLSGVVKFVDSEEELFAAGDYISLHLPYNSATKYKINADSIAKMKDGVRIINSSRAEIVNDDDILAALESGKVARYVSDFPNSKTANAKGVIAIPHLAASTPESEDNCAIMAADQISEYLLSGNIVNSVNLPNISLEREGNVRVTVLSKGDIISELLSTVAASGEKTLHCASATRGDYGAAILDLDKLDEALLSKLSKISGVIRLKITD